MKSRLLIACALVLAGCASGPSDKRAISKTGGVPAESLPAQTLAPGACGLFLWTQDQPPRFVFFYPASAASADAIVNGQQVKLATESQRGDLFAQFMTEMTFKGPGGSLVKLSLQPGEVIDGGRRVPVARLISQDREGWEIITPLAGLTACQPE